MTAEAVAARLSNAGVLSAQVQEDGPFIQARVLRDPRQLTATLTALGSYAFAVGNSPLEQVVGGLLVARGMTLALAESCTGGLAGHLVTNVSGSSHYFLMGVVSYSNDAKVRLLGVSQHDLERHGAVSQSVVEQMALGVRRLAGSDIGVGISGIAGPTGGTKSKPVGTVWMAVGGAGGCHSECFRFTGDRTTVKTQAAYAALNLVRLALTGELEGVVD